MKSIFFSKNRTNDEAASRLPALILALILVLLAAASGLYLLLAPGKTAAGAVVRITQAGSVIREIPFSEITEPLEFTVTGDNGCYNIIRISPEGVQVTEASCPDKICIRTGMRKDSLLPIICLPNQLVIEIVTEDGLSDMDAVTY
jgi:hypothetical protein